MQRTSLTQLQRIVHTSARHIRSVKPSTATAVRAARTSAKSADPKQSNQLEFDSDAAMLKAIFAKDSLGLLVKKFLCYKLMGSNLFINYSLAGMGLCYKLLGVRLTNLCINASVGSLFTSGESI